jgi:hypothetical protein
MGLPPGRRGEEGDGNDAAGFIRSHCGRRKAPKNPGAVLRWKKDSDVRKITLRKSPNFII